MLPPPVLPGFTPNFMQTATVKRTQIFATRLSVSGKYQDYLVTKLFQKGFCHRMSSGRGGRGGRHGGRGGGQ